MTSLFLGFVNWGGVPADEKDVRNTATPVNPEKPAAEMPDQPIMQEFHSDSDPSLGMSPRQLASKWVQGVSGAPAWSGQVAGATESTTMINRQVSTSGSAAAREMEGQTNPNLSYAVGIEPVQDLVPGGAFGNDYFVRNERIIQETSDNTMMTQPPGYDQISKGKDAAAGKKNARDAAVAALYNTWWNGGN